MRLEIIRPGRYGTRRMQAGDEYVANSSVGRVLVALGRAKLAGGEVDPKPLARSPKTVKGKMVKKTTIAGVEENVDPSNTDLEVDRNANPVPEAPEDPNSAQAEAMAGEGEAGTPVAAEPVSAHTSEGSGLVKGGTSKPWEKKTSKKK